MMHRLSWMMKDKCVIFAIQHICTLEAAKMIEISIGFYDYIV